jgi:nitroreductase
VELYEAMTNAPATRRFRSEPVPPDVLRRVLDNARFAPSGGNRQPWRVVAVDDPELRQKLRDLYVPNWDQYLGDARALLDADEPPEGVSPGRFQGLRRADRFARNLQEVPLHLIVCVELDALAIVDSELERQSIVGGASVYPFVQNLLLGLRAEGLGASLTTLITPSEEEVRKLLDLPEGVAIAALLGVGYREDPWPKKLSRRPVEEFAHANRWGEPLGG